MEMWERGDVPGVAGQGTGNEAGNVVDQVTNDNFDNFLGKSGCGGKMNSRLLWNIREDVFNSGFGSVPDLHREQLGGCGTSK